MEPSPAPAQGAQSRDRRRQDQRFRFQPNCDLSASARLASSGANAALHVARQVKRLTVLLVRQLRPSATPPQRYVDFALPRPCRLATVPTAADEAPWKEAVVWLW